MQVIKKNKNLEYTYKIIPGISNIKGGIQILEDLNYPDEIVKNSIDMLNKSINTFI